MTTHLRSGREWQLFLTTAIESANDAVILYEAGDREPLVINYVNRMFEEQTGYSREEAIGKTRELLYGPQTDQAAATAMREDIWAGRSAFGELLKYRKDGSTYWAEVNIRPFFDHEGFLVGAVSIERDVTRRRVRSAELERTRTLLDAIMEHTKSAIFVKDLEGRYLFVNREYERLHDIKERGVLGKTDFDLFPVSVAERLRENDRRALRSHTPIYEEEPVPTPDGVLTFLTVKFPLYSRDGRPYATCGMATNINQRAETMQRLELLEFALDHARDAICIYRLDGDGTWCIHYANQSMSTMTGYSFEELIGKTSDIIVGPDTDRNEIEFSREQLKSGVEITAEWRAYRKDGSAFWVEFNATPLASSAGGPQFTVVVYRDITKKKQQEEQLSFEASHDQLTGLFNRRYLERSIELAVSDARARVTEHGIVMLDLDGFKDINDRHGHDAGDKLLTALSILMASRLRRGDVLARLGGDEFAIILLGCSNEQSQVLATELLSAVAGYAYPHGAERLAVTASAGVTAIDPSSVDARAVLRQADAACYAAKRKGKNCVSVARANG